MNEAPVYEGTVLAGKYRVEKVLGFGGMGVVVAATHLQLEERVALKFLTSDALLSGEAVARFAREARAAVKIKSEHVARVIDVGTLETGAPYMVMEYLEGSDLSQVLSAKVRLPVEEAVEYILQACEALAEAHVLGIIHRDLKPANLFLIRRPDGTDSIKVLDFGISKVMPGKGSSSDNAMTRTSTVMGSPLYMSPEQMASTRDVDGRTDIWALGVILFELVSGEPPFQADTLPQLCALVLNSSARSVRSIVPQVPVGLDAVLQRCLQREPARRFRDVAELANALADFAPRRARASVDRISRVLQGGVTDRGVMVGTATAPALPTSPSWAETHGPLVTKKSRGALWAGAGIVAAIIAAVLIWVTKGAHSAPGSSADERAVSLTSAAPSAPPVPPVVPVQVPSAEITARTMTSVAVPTQPSARASALPAGHVTKKAPALTKPATPPPAAASPSINAVEKSPSPNLFDERK